MYPSLLVGYVFGFTKPSELLAAGALGGATKTSRHTSFDVGLQPPDHKTRIEIAEGTAAKAASTL